MSKATILVLPIFVHSSHSCFPRHERLTFHTNYGILDGGRGASDWQGKKLFDALGYRNYRLYWSGIFLSAIGSWVQNTAQGWLVYDLTHSKLMLGVVGFVGSLPVTFLTLLAGVLADRVDRRKLLFVPKRC